MVADMEVDKVVDKVADMVADMATDKKGRKMGHAKKEEKWPCNKPTRLRRWSFLPTGW